MSKIVRMESIIMKGFIKEGSFPWSRRFFFEREGWKLSAEEE